MKKSVLFLFGFLFIGIGSLYAQLEEYYSVGNAERELIRTNKTPFEAEALLKVPVYRVVQKQVWVFGPNFICGYEKVCNNGHCYDKMKACWHYETKTEYVFDHNKELEFSLTFAENAKLLFGEKERVIIWYDSNWAGVKIKDAAYNYTGKLEKKVNLNEGKADFDILAKNRKKITPPNTMTYYVSKKKEGVATLGLKDLGFLDNSQAGASDYFFEIWQKISLFPDRLIAKGQFRLEEKDNEIFSFTKDSKYLVKDRYFELEKEYVVVLYLKRTSPFYNNNNSESIKFNFVYLEEFKVED